MLRGLLVLSLLASVLLWMRTEALQQRLALREQQLANHQAVLEAVAQTGKLHEADLEPLLLPIQHGPPTQYTDGHAWEVHAPERRPDTTDYPDTSLMFSADGRLIGVHAYKP